LVTVWEEGLALVWEQTWGCVSADRLEEGLVGETAAGLAREWAQKSATELVEG
jgi:hypothetical protein